MEGGRIVYLCCRNQAIVAFIKSAARFEISPANEKHIPYRLQSIFASFLDTISIKRERKNAKNTID